MKPLINRRTFLHRSAVFSAGLAASGKLVRAAPASPASKIVVAVMGTNARGIAHIEGLLAAPNVEIGCICDVDDRAIAKGIKAAAARQGKEPRGEKDIRRVLEDKGIDAIHSLDLARWGLGVDRPRRVTFGGGRYLVRDDQESPDTGVAAFDFGDKLITWEQSSSHARAADKFGFVTFYGEGGTLAIADSGYTIFDVKGKETGGRKRGESGDVVAGPGGEALHFANFLDCIRDDKRPNSDIEEGQKGTMLCHYANLAVRTGRAINVDPETGKVTGDEQAMALWKRDYRPGWEPVV